MDLKQYKINNRTLTYHLPLPEEFQLEKDSNYLFELPELTSLSVIGEHAMAFLQGQLSCDLRQVTKASMQQGAMCNLKGRILALLDVVLWEDFRLLLPKDLLQLTEDSLAKTAALSRVQLKPASDLVFGLYLPNPQDVLPQHFVPRQQRFSVTQTKDFCCYCLDHPLYLLILAKDKTNLIEFFYKNHNVRGSLCWHYLQLKQKQIQIYPDTRGLFLPHRLDLHLSGHLNFNKGCYKGQEIIARTHYKAKLKHHLSLFTVETTLPLSAGKRLLNASKQEVGEIIDFCPLQPHCFLLAASILLDHPSSVTLEGYEDKIELKTASWHAPGS